MRETSGDSSSKEEFVEGTIKSVVFHNEENGWTVLHIEEPADFASYRGKETTVVGKCRAVWEGEDIRAKGSWVRDPVHGRQFKAETIECVAPKTIAGIERYLASGIIRGVGKVIAKRIVETFGVDTLHVLSHQSGRLREVPKLGATKIRQIRESWLSNEAMRENLIFGQSYGISIGKMSKIVHKFGQDAIAIIKADPYCLCREIWGIGFSTADRIALSVGIPPDSPLRARATIHYALRTEADETGNCWTFESDLLIKANELTSIAIETLAAALADEIEKGNIIAEAQEGGENMRRIYLRSIYRCEVLTAFHLRRLTRRASSFPKINTLVALKWWESQAGFELSEDQRTALCTCLDSKVSVITGGPGVGKTTIIKALVDIYRARKLNVQLCAPTGRASKRMMESVGATATTIHRLLKWNPRTNSFSFNVDNKCDGDVFIVDETSMIDIKLAADIFSALPDGATLVLVGDTDQLPSVGPGNVLSDVINSGVVPYTRLNRIFRQDSKGLIVRNAHNVNQGRAIETNNDINGDFFFVKANDPQQCLQRAIEFMTERIPRQFGFDAMRDIQVLTPMRRNGLGTDNLNIELQRVLNNSGDEVRRGGTIFRVGDRVMQLRNNYDKDVFNGDIGFVKAVSAEERSMIVEFDGEPVKYDAGELDELMLSYAMTIHKSQGSEYPAIVVLIHNQHYVMLQRNLLYTAITRGKKLVVLIGTPFAVEKAIANNTVKERRTTLAVRLRAK